MSAMKKAVWATTAVFFLGGASAFSSNRLNEAFGIPLWGEKDLWIDDAHEAARRLKLEGDGPVYQSFYNPILGSAKGLENQNIRVLGAQIFAIQLFEDEKRASVKEVTVTFSNRPDIERAVQSNILLDFSVHHHDGQRKSKSKVPSGGALSNDQEVELRNMIALKTEQWLDRARTTDLPAIRAALSKWTGSSRKLDDQHELWEDARHEYLLIDSKDGFSLKIQKKGAAGKSDKKNHFELANLKGTLSKNVFRRGNGDLVIVGMPNISQGARNYCTTATWQKVLRFYGFDEDIFALAETGGTTTHGSDGSIFAAKMAVDLQAKGMRVEYIQGKAGNMDAYRSYLDKGIPVIWNMDARFLPIWYVRNKSRSLRLPGKDVGRKELAAMGFDDFSAPHTLLIIGYNYAAHEIALSDSTEMGHGEPEIWIRLNEAREAHELFDGSQLLAVVPSKSPVSPVSKKKYY